jgi:hypothetical protein
MNLFDSIHVQFEIQELIYIANRWYRYHLMLICILQDEGSTQGWQRAERAERRAKSYERVKLSALLARHSLVDS